MLGEHHGGRLQHLDVLVGVFLAACGSGRRARRAPGRRAGSAPPAASDRSPRPSPAGRRRPGGSDASGSLIGDAELGAAADEALAALHARVVHGAGVEAFGGEQLERAVLALEVDRADLGDHEAGDLAHDLVEPRLAVDRLGHDLAQTPHDDAQRRLGGHDSGLVAASAMPCASAARLVRASRPAVADPRAAACGLATRRLRPGAAPVAAQSASRP